MSSGAPRPATSRTDDQGTAAFGIASVSVAVTQ